MYARHLLLTKAFYLFHHFRPGLSFIFLKNKIRNFLLGAVPPLNWGIPTDLYSRNPSLQKADEEVLHRWEGLTVVLQAFLSNNSHLVLMVHLLNPLCRYRCEFLTAVGLFSTVAGPTSSAFCVIGQKVHVGFFVTTPMRLKVGFLR